MPRRRRFPLRHLRQSGGLRVKASGCTNSCLYFCDTPLSPLLKGIALPAAMAQYCSPLLLSGAVAFLADVETSFVHVFIYTFTYLLDIFGYQVKTFLLNVFICHFLSDAYGNAVV